MRTFQAPGVCRVSTSIASKSPNLRRLNALIGAAVLAVLIGTPAEARQRHKAHWQNHDLHGVGDASYGPHHQSFWAARSKKRQSWPVATTTRKPWPVASRIQQPKPPAAANTVKTATRKPWPVASTTQQPKPAAAANSRDCLTPDTRALLARLEATFGPVELASTCRPEARMPTGEVSWHARNRAFDFLVPKHVDKRDVMVWLSKNSPGVTMSYRSSPHIHTDTGSFHKVIYNAANHEAGERAVAIWKARALLASAPPLPKPRPESVAARSIALASADPGDPLHEYLESPADRVPGPITPSDRVGIFRRYFQTKEVMVMAHTSLMCPNGAPFPTELMRLLQDASSHFGRTAVVNSGYRTPERNRRVGGARNSQHMKCRAIDFRVAGVSVGDLRRYLMSNLHKWGIRGLGTYGMHVHADVGDRKTTRVVTWTGGRKRHAKPRHQRYASAG